MIFFLSDTGNTRWAAESIAQATSDALLFIPDIMRQSRAEQTLAFKPSANERIGFCFPVHGWRPPNIVRAFIRRLRIDAARHFVYALCTAGDNIGEAVDIFEADLLGSGMHLDAAFSLIMPESYVGLPFFNIDKPDKERSKKEKAAKDLKSAIQCITGRHRERRLTIGHWPRIDSRILGAFFNKYLITDRPFHVESLRCVKCGICADVCPVKNINGGLGFEPQWKRDGSCLACFACYHHCPHHAIEYDHMTQGKGQYFFKKRSL